jgi:hypothetical protein
MIYVEMTAFSLSVDGVTPRPQASCEVRVIDVVDQVRLFPKPDSNPETYAVEVDLREMQQQPGSGVTAAMKRELEEKLARALGKRVGQMFYAWIPDEIGTRLTPN